MEEIGLEVLREKMIDKIICKFNNSGFARFDFIFKCFANRKVSSLIYLVLVFFRVIFLSVVV